MPNLLKVYLLKYHVIFGWWNILFLSSFFINLSICLFFIFVCTGSSLLKVFSDFGEQGLLLTVVCGLLIAVFFLVAEHGL